MLKNHVDSPLSCGEKWIFLKLQDLLKECSFTKYFKQMPTMCQEITSSP